MKRTMNKNGWILLVLMLVGLVLGGLIGSLTQNIPALNWLNYGQSFGLDSPIVLDLGILVITFGLSIRITIAGIVGLMLSAILYRFL